MGGRFRGSCANGTHWAGRKAEGRAGARRRRRTKQTNRTKNNKEEEEELLGIVEDITRTCKFMLNHLDISVGGCPKSCVSLGFWRVSEIQAGVGCQSSQEFLRRLISESPLYFSWEIQSSIAFKKVPEGSRASQWIVVCGTRKSASPWAASIPSSSSSRKAMRTPSFCPERQPVSLFPSACFPPLNSCHRFPVLALVRIKLNVLFCGVHSSDVSIA